MKNALQIMLNAFNLPTARAARLTLDKQIGSENLKKAAVGELMRISDVAAREAGGVFSELGQQDFDDAVFFDLQMSPEQKIVLLQISDDGTLSDKTKDYIQLLTEYLAEQQAKQTNALIGTMNV